MAFYKGRQDQGEGLVLFWCHVLILHRLDVWDGPRVSLSSALRCLIDRSSRFLSPPLGGYISHIPSKHYISSQFAPTTTRSEIGTTFYSTCATTRTSSTSCSSGFSLLVLLCGWRATACPMGLWPVLSLLGGIAWCSMIQIKSRHCSSTSILR